MDIILGSSSPRRKKILGSLFSNFSIIHPSADETILAGETPEQYAARISRLKADAIIASLAPVESEKLVITADTIVTINGEILGKPADIDDAVTMLKKLSGKTHGVITSMTVAHLNNNDTKVITQSEKTAVTFKKMNVDEIIHYLSLIDYSDKAGSYAFQEHRGLIIDKISGSATNVIGFPLTLFFSILVEMGLPELIC
ncbi:MAG TPA: Maf family protein [Spirochaetota bacterium]|nr:Maf family protein [Spirochaetota bacterium]HPI91020.1 Maf family protein [Spirochaetota bacterium]HPR48600.1 Maf family protein [Spirochaetota bacterium]